MGTKSSPRKKRQVCEATHLHLLKRKIMVGAIPRLPIRRHGVVLNYIIEYKDEFVFTVALRVNAGKVFQVRQRPDPSTSFPIPYSLSHP
jgi:hypothetical protein